MLMPRSINVIMKSALDHQATSQEAHQRMIPSHASVPAVQAAFSSYDMFRLLTALVMTFLWQPC